MLIQRWYRPIGLLALLLVLAACGAPAQTQVNSLLNVSARITSISTVVTTSIPPTSTSTPTTVSAPSDNHTPAASMNMSGMVMDAGTPPPGSDAERGKALFVKGIGNPAVPVCTNCHYDDKDEVKVGPALVDVATHGIMHAQEHGQDLATFLRTSIVNPNADIMEDPSHVFATNGVSLMYQNYGKDLNEQQIADLVAYLMTLK